MMLCDIHKALGINDSFNAELIGSALSKGHDWAIDWEYDLVLPENVTTNQEVIEVSNILDMWGFIEGSYANLDPAGKGAVKGALGHEPKFMGFDGNNEGTQFSIARFLVEEMGRYTNFKGHTFNSHMPTRDRYNRAYEKFSQIRPNLIAVDMSADQIITVLV